jgi:hypothetical protein
MNPFIPVWIRGAPFHRQCGFWRFHPKTRNPTEQAKLTERYAEQFSRYTGKDLKAA